VRVKSRPANVFMLAQKTVIHKVPRQRVHQIEARTPPRQVETNINQHDMVYFSNSQSDLLVGGKGKKATSRAPCVAKMR